MTEAAGTVLAPYKNRIVGHGDENPAQLLASPKNWRVHPHEQEQALAATLSEVGWVANVIVNRRTGFVVDGHLRVAHAISRGEPTIPVTYVDLSEAEEALILATFDPITAMAGADREQLDALLRDIDTGDEALQAMLSDLAEQSGLAYGQPEPVEAPEPQLDRAEELRQQWGTEAGQLWLIPSKSVPGREHRLLCGDSTKAEDVARLLPRAINLVWTDPPYGVSYGAKNEFLNAIARGNRIQTPIEGDQGSELQTADLLEGALTLAHEYAVSGAACYVAAPARPVLRDLMNAMDASGFRFHWQLVWLKQQFVLGRSDYHFRHENLLYGWKEGSHYFTDDRGIDSVFEVDKPHVSNLHPTTKPVELVAPMIENSSRRGETVYDPFLGSGTTVVAAEQIGRLGCGCELTPGYSAVALQRLADMGLEPRLADA